MQKININSSIYTDADFCPKNMFAVCGYIIIYLGNPIKRVVTIIENVKDIFQAEEYAVLLSLQEDFLLHYVNNINIISDNNGVVKSLNEKSNRLLRETRQIIFNYKKNVIGLNFTWVKSHNGNHYNELIDNDVRTVFIQEKERRKIIEIK